jgi:hypothetical protein
LRGKVYRNISISSLEIKREREKRMYMNAWIFMAFFF